MVIRWKYVIAVAVILKILFIVSVAPLVNIWSTPKEEKYRPIIFIPGLGGNQLEARVVGPVKSGCKTYPNWYRIWMDVWTFLNDGVDCWAENMKLKYDEASGRSYNSEGVTVRVPGFGSTETVEYVDSSWTAWLLGDLGSYLAYLVQGPEPWVPGFGFIETVEYIDSSWTAWLLGDLGSYLAYLVQELVSHGYTRGESIRAAPYDFRLAPHSQPGYFLRLKHLIEETYAINEDQPVLLLAHSLGGIFSTYFLKNATQEWKEKYVAGLVTLNTPWGGTAMSIIMFTTGYNWEIDYIDRLVIRSQQRTYESAVLVLPRAPVWTAEDTLVKVGSLNYTVQNYSDFFQAINYTDGVHLRRLSESHEYEQQHPNVSVYCLYSSGIPTTAELHFDDAEGFPDATPRQIFGEGDGTVNIRSLQACSQWESHPRHPVKIENFENVGHNDILSNKAFFARLLEIARIS